MDKRSLIIIGASARAAACSAARAGFSPYWLDQFGDTDLRARFPGQVITAYPQQATTLIEQAPAAPFMYTGAMENYSEALEGLCARRRLLGNPAQACLNVGDPFRLHDLFEQSRIPGPEVRADAHVGIDPRAWLVKPLHSAGGSGIRFCQEADIGSGTGSGIDVSGMGSKSGPDCYLQQYLPGDSYSAVFVGTRDGSRLLGVTRQLVGVPEFHAPQFGYCGSIGPVELATEERQQWERIGAVLVAEFQLRGLFGVDAIRHDGRVHPVEVNPRYTASVEVLELALEVQALQLHCQACAGQPIEVTVRPPHRLIGKAILYAPADLVFKAVPPHGFSGADIPPTGAHIKQGHPVLTIIVNGTAIDAINQELKQAAGYIMQGIQ